MMEPKIRFKGFEGEWKEYSFSDILIVNSGKDYKHLDNGIIPVYGTGGYMLSVNESLSDIDAIGIGRKGTIDKPQYLKAPFWTVDTLFFLTTKNNDNLDFLYNLSQNIKWKKYDESTGVPSLSKSNIDKIKTHIPYIAEQQEIASYFTSLDSQISAATSRLAALKQMKAASLQAMFPQEGETVPKIRFKGFEGEWKKVKLSEILTERHENSTITDSLPQLSFTIADGVIRPEDRKSNKRDFLIKDIDNKRYLVTKVGDIIYNPANVVYGAIHRNSLMNGVVSPIYKIFTTMQDSNFIECAVRRPSFITKLAMCTEGTVTKLKTLKPEAFLNMEVCITPSLEEQKLIGNYFTSLDRQISLQSQRLEKLKQIKSACLDKMFV